MLCAFGWFFSVCLFVQFHCVFITEYFFFVVSIIVVIFILDMGFIWGKRKRKIYWEKRNIIWGEINSVEIQDLLLCLSVFIYLFITVKLLMKDYPSIKTIFGKVFPSCFEEPLTFDYIYPRTFSPDVIVILCGWLGSKHPLTITYPRNEVGGVYWNHSIHLSMCLGCVQTVSLEPVDPL